ncbi:MAG TPA: hypothetical protein VN030_11525 [Cellvibrio sp.]|nr:hypothetical protein [Cellvibrio sp.]
MGLLRRVAAGIAGAGVDIANDQLAMLRQQRLMEVQQNFRREERAEDRAERQTERDQAMALQAKRDARDDARYAEQTARQDRYHNDDMAASNRNFAATQENTRNDNNRVAHNDELNEASLAYAGASAGLAAIDAELFKIKGMRPRQNANGELLDNPDAFNTWQKDLTSELNIKRQAEVDRIKPIIQDLDKRYSKFNHIFGNTRTQ